MSKFTYNIKQQQTNLKLWIIYKIGPSLKFEMKFVVKAFVIE